MPSFVNLPPELILHVIAQEDKWRPAPGVFSLETGRRKALLMSLCRTCAYLRSIVQPKLYETVEITEITRRSRHRSLRLLTWTITSRPDLAAKTKTLLLKLGGFSRETVRSRDIIAIPEPAEELKARDSLLCTLFSNLPNLLELDFKDNDRTDYFWTRLFTSASDGRRNECTLPALQSLSIHPHHTRAAPFNLADLTSCFAQPGLRTVSIKFAASFEHHPRWGSIALQPHSIHLTTLELTNCHVPPRALQTLLLACIELKKFVYDCPTVGPMYGALMKLQETDYFGFVDPRLDEVMSSVRPQEVLYALTSCVGSLEELELVFDSDVRRNPHGLKPLSFSRFERLRKLRIQQRVFSLLDRLPKTLECLALSDCFYRTFCDPDWAKYQDIRSLTQCPTLQQLSMAGVLGGPRLEELEQQASHCKYGTLRKDGNLIQSHRPRFMAFHINGLEIHLTNNISLNSI
jgi:hypothetical protein